MKPNHSRMLAFACLLAFGCLVWSRLDVERSKLDIAILVCDTCGMDRDWVEQTIEDIRASGQSREEAIAAWEVTYDDPDVLAEARELCSGCVEAVVVAALGNTP